MLATEHKKNSLQILVTFISVVHRSLFHQQMTLELWTLQVSIPEVQATVLQTGEQKLPC